MIQDVGQLQANQLSQNQSLNPNQLNPTQINQMGFSRQNQYNTGLNDMG